MSTIRSSIQQFDEEIQHIRQEIAAGRPKPTMLLHVCCGPCSSAVIEQLSEVFQITLYYYNPNMDTVDEFKKRLTEQIKVINKLPSTNPIKLIEGNYFYIDKTHFIKEWWERGDDVTLIT